MDILSKHQATRKPKIAIDGIFFQLQNTGIARVWRSLLQEWVKSGFAEHILFLDRNHTAPKIPGISYQNIQRYDYQKTGGDSLLLEQICVQENIDLFISSYYTTPTATPSVFMAHDMIPEVMNSDLDAPMWREKHYGILHACAYITVSHNTARDLVRFFPEVANKPLIVAHNGIDENFTPASSEQISQLQEKYGISKPYFLIVGDRVGVDGYKNAIHLFKAINKLPDKSKFSLVCTGQNTQLEPELVNLATDLDVHSLYLDETELLTAYSGAVALVYPSLYEGFGLPILEAMACGCPVITCENSSIPEVAGKAALYVSGSDVDDLVKALIKVQDPPLRQALINAGFEQIKQFDWAKMAEIVADFLLVIADKINHNNLTTSPSTWVALRQMQQQLQTSQEQTQFLTQQQHNSQQQIETLHQQLQESQVHLQESQMQLQVTQKEYNQANQKLSATQQLVAEIRGQFDYLNTVRLRLIGELHHHNETLEHRYQQQKRQIQKLKKNNSKHKKINNKLKKKNTTLKKELAYASSARAAMRKLAKTLLQKTGLYNLVYNQKQLFIPAYNFLFRDQWQPKNQVDNIRLQKENEQEKNETSLLPEAQLSTKRIDMCSPTIEALLITRDGAIEMSYEQLELFSTLVKQINNLLCINPPPRYLPLLQSLAKNNISITCLGSDKNYHHLNFQLPIVNQKLGEWMINQQVTNLTEYDTILINHQVSSETLLLLKGRISPQTKVIVIEDS